jgi:hypothetical protein
MRQMRAWCAVFAVGVLAVGCGSTEQPAAAGSSGAFGIVTVDGKQKLYLPVPGYASASGHGEIAVVDVGVEGNGIQGANAQLTRIDLGTSEYATTTGGDATVIVAASTAFPTVWLIDPHSDTVTQTLTLPDTYGTSSFSGGGGYVTGVAMDSANHRAILSVWNGFALLDTGSGEITQVIEAPPSENFGYDSVNQRIIAPFYECASAYAYSSDGAASLPFCADYQDTAGTEMTDGVNVIDLATGTVFTYQDPTYDTQSTGGTGNSPVDSEPDSAAGNPTTGVVVVASEGAGNKHVIDLGSASFDEGSKSVTAPQQVFEDQYAGLTGVSIEPSRNLAFFEGEGSSNVGVLPLDGATDGEGAVLVATLPDLPDGNGWSNMGDPHGIAVSTGINDGKSVGFVVTYDGQWVARVDLEAFAAMTPGEFGTVDPATFASAVTYLKVQ